MSGGLDSGWTPPCLAVSHPNPFTVRSQISYEIPTGGPVSLYVYDAGGRKVRALVDATQAAGSHTTSWDGRDDSGALLPAGSYFYRLDVGGVQQSRRVLLLR